MRGRFIIGIIASLGIFSGSPALANGDDSIETTIPIPGYCAISLNPDLGKYTAYIPIIVMGSDALPFDSSMPDIAFSIPGEDLTCTFSKVKKAPDFTSGPVEPARVSR